MSDGERDRKASPEPVSDEDGFRSAVEAHSSERWPVFEHLAALTGILAGSDGPRSFGIFCRRCGFGLRAEGATGSSMRSAFTEEAVRRTCEHWSIYLEHPAAFFDSD